MKTKVRAVVIGGGVVGVSSLYHLAQKGWGDDVVLLERNELTSGSTWHAAGLLPLFNMSYSVGQIHKYSVELYQRLEAETGQAVGLKQVGNIRLAMNQERMEEMPGVREAYFGSFDGEGLHFSTLADETASFCRVFPELSSRYRVRFLRLTGGDDEDEISIFDLVFPQRTRIGTHIYVMRSILPDLPKGEEPSNPELARKTTGLSCTPCGVVDFEGVSDS